jgi:protein-disulfide isomerase
MPSVKTRRPFPQNNLRYGLYAVTVALLLLASPQAGATTGEAAPDPTANPALAALKKSGAEFFYAGRISDFDGWMMVKDEHTQMVYKPADKDYAIIGNLYAPNGDDISAEQIKKVKAAHTLEKINPVTENEAKNAPLPAGERLLKDLEKSYGVTLGGDSTKPLLIALVLPSSDPSKLFWQTIRRPVQAGTLRVRLYPAGLKNSEDERSAAKWLNTNDPLTTWNKFIAGDKTVLAGAANQADIDKVRVNTALIDKWRFPTAPYLLYRAKNGSMKVVQGNPTDIKTLLDDIGPEKQREATP